MSTFDNFQIKKTAASGVSVDGAFACQLCNEVVDEAILLPDDGIIIWECSEGHKSKMKSPF